MPTSKNSFRQSSLSVVVPLTVANTGVNTVTADLPPGALLSRVNWFTQTAFNGSSVTITGTISDGTTVFVSAEDLKTAGAEVVDIINKYYPNGGTLTFSIVDTNNDSTLGLAIASATYVIVGRSNSIQE